MKTFRPIWILLALVVAPTHRAPAVPENWQFDPEEVSQAGQEIFELFAPDSIEEEYEFASAEDIAATFSSIQEALTGETVEALATAQPRAKQTLATLRANPNTQGQADWLAARMDYFDMAAEMAHALPSTKPTPPIVKPLPPHPAPTQPKLPPHPTTSQKTLPPHPTATPKPLPPHPKTPAPKPKLTPHPTQPPVVASSSAPAAGKNRTRYVDNKQLWLRKLSGRAAPSRAAALLPKLKKIFRSEGIPAALVWQAEAESTFNPAARSPVGAAGLYQFMPATAREFGLRLKPKDERFDALKNARAAAQYLKLLYRRFGTWPLALAAYNCGQGRVSKTLRAQNGKTFDDIHLKLPAETRMYVPKIAALVQLRENADLDHL